MMKTKILSFLFLAGMVLVGMSTYADDEVNVTPGGTYTYNVSQTNGNTTGAVFHWSISPGIAGTDYTDITSETGESVSVSWNTAGSYTISVYVVDGTGCQSETKTLDVTVNDTQFCVDAANATNKQTCSLIDGPANGNTTFTSWGTPENTQFDVSVTDPAIVGNYTIHYNATDGTNPTGDLTATVTTTAIGTTATQSITISHATHPDLFTNTGTTDKTVTIEVTKIVDPNSVDITANCGTTSYDVIVSPQPIIAF